MNEQKRGKDFASMTQAELAAHDAKMEEDYRKAVAATKSRRQKFQTSFVIFPMRWVDALEGGDANGNAYRLALRLLAEAHARTYRGGDVVLSSEVTRLQRNNKYRAAEKLQALGLIHIERRRAKQSPVIHVLASRAKRKPKA
jgi:hypothetical protein